MKSWFVILSCVVACVLTGCGTQPNPAPPGPGPAPVKGGVPEVKGHSHGAGPHGGAIADWGGGKYHVEFKVDHGKKETTIYVLGDDGKTDAPIKAEKIQLSINQPATQIELAAQPQASDPAGSSSRFVGTHENLGKVQEFAGTITGVIDGTPFTGDFAETPEM